MPRELPLPPTVTAETRNIEYAELSADVTIPAQQNTATATVNLPSKSVNVESLRVYPPDGYNGLYSIELLDSAGNVFYRFVDHTGVLVDLNGVIIQDDNAQIQVRITVPSAVSADTSFVVKIGLSYIA